jgi:glutamate-1-semialdehyde 2,1-aminomutase
MESGEKTREMFQRAKNCLAHGVTSNYRYWGDTKSLVLKEGKGAYIWDQDDNKYLVRSCYPGPWLSFRY